MLNYWWHQSLCHHCAQLLVTTIKVSITAVLNYWWHVVLVTLSCCVPRKNSVDLYWSVNACCSWRQSTNHCWDATLRQISLTGRARVAACCRFWPQFIILFKSTMSADLTRKVLNISFDGMFRNIFKSNVHCQQRSIIVHESSNSCEQYFKILHTLFSMEQSLKYQYLQSVHTLILSSSECFWRLWKIVASAFPVKNILRNIIEGNSE